MSTASFQSAPLRGNQFVAILASQSPSIQNFAASVVAIPMKTGHFGGDRMQVGSLAQVLIGYAQGHKLTHKWTGEAMNRISAISRKRAAPAMLHSTPGRIAAPLICASMLADLANKHGDLLVKNIASRHTKAFANPRLVGEEIHDAGFHEAPCGTLSHWLVIKSGRIECDRAIVPVDWNAGPGHAHDCHGPCEASLPGNPVADAPRPFRVLRAVHSFDPGLACAMHTFDSAGKEIISVS